MKKESESINHYWKDVFRESLPDYGLLGHQISYSLSPNIHRFVMGALGIHGDYKLLDVPPEEFDEFMSHPHTNAMKGLNITKPYKWLAAKKLGSTIPVNTIYGNQQMTNTDCTGFIKTLQNHSISIQQMEQLLVYGGGGFAYSIINYVQQHYPKISITCFTRKTIDPLPGVKRFLIKNSQELSHADPYKKTIVLHATSSHDAFQPVKLYETRFSRFSDSVFVDANYGEKRTIIFNKLAPRMKCIDGLMLLVEQARESQLLWWKKTIESGRIMEHIESLSS